MCAIIPGICIRKKGKPVLVITRTPNQHLHIGEKIEIKVIKVNGASISIGISAPKHLTITPSTKKHVTVIDENYDSALTPIQDRTPPSPFT
ncbi:hypothetical protein PflCFBP13517_25545 [Pseudomonas fluorescens]|nr:hypothetical protein PflCFBP13517_25545 [Pseudomonas fluorescens]